MKRLVHVCLSVMAAAVLAAPLQARAQEAAPAAPAAPPANAVAQPEAAQAEKAAETSVLVVDSATVNEPVVSMVFDETPLIDVIKAFRDATGANIIAMSGTNMMGKVSVRLEKVPWRKGLSSILDTQGFQLTEQPAGSGIYMVDVKTTVIPKVTRAFALTHARALDVALLFKSTFGLNMDALPLVMKTATNLELASFFKSLAVASGNGTVTPYGAANTVIVTATEQQLGECEKILLIIDKPRPQVYIEARFVELSAGASKKLGLQWDSLGGNGWGASFDGATLGFGSQKISREVHGMETVTDTSSIDNTPGDSEWDDDGNVRTLPGTTTTSSSRTVEYEPDGSIKERVTTFTGSLTVDQFRLALNAFEQLDGASVFSNPKIIVANEEEALVDMTTKEPNVSVKSTRSGTAGDQLDVTAELSKIPGLKEPFVGEAFYSYGISLKVVPRVSPSGQITVEIEPSISDKVGTYAITGLSEGTPIASYPIIAMQRLQTVFTMQNGTTAVIGGLSKTIEENIDSGIPLLRKLPWIGPRIFGWKSREKTQKEIIIFVTVGLADPVNLPEDIGMPKNAVLGRELFTGELKEPGDRAKQDLLSLDDPVVDNMDSTPAKPAAADITTEREAIEKPQAEAPAPAVKNNP